MRHWSKEKVVESMSSVKVVRGQASHWGGLAGWEGGA